MQTQMHPAPELQLRIQLLKLCIYVTNICCGSLSCPLQYFTIKCVPEFMCVCLCMHACVHAYMHTFMYACNV